MEYLGYSRHAGGTCAMEGRHGFTKATPFGTVHIDPLPSPARRGFMVRFSLNGAATPRETHGGLWHDLGKVWTLRDAHRAARRWQVRQFGK